MTREASPGAAWRYDLFVIHADAEEPFVLGYLLDALALPDERVLRLQTLDLGHWTADEIDRGVRSSAITMPVLSPACQGDDWAGFAQRLATYASEAERATRLLPVLLEDCDLTTHIAALEKLDFRDRSPDAWRAQLEKLRAVLRRPTTSVPHADCPYPGMRAFTGDESRRFFGRDDELEHIVHVLHSGRREICIVGASGSGKSSLIAAGLVPRLARSDRPLYCVRSLRPGRRPFEQLTTALEAERGAPAAIDALLAREAPGGSLLLIVDQLEELFAISDDDQRERFLEVLAMIRSDSRCALVLALRADFYDKFLTSPLSGNYNGRMSRIDLLPLHVENLRSSIERPARDQGVYFERELVSRLLDEADEPGALPLLQETLVQLWARRRRCLIALADYEPPGREVRPRLALAVEAHADDVLGRMTDDHAAIAWRILLRLVAFGEGRADTRRQQPRDTLRSTGEDPAKFGVVLQRLVEHRLLTVTGDDQRGEPRDTVRRDVRVDLAHEVLIQAWRRFAKQIETWRSDEKRRRELEATAAAWSRRARKDAGLLDPEDFAAAVAWQDRAARTLGHSEELSQLLRASQRAHASAKYRRWRDRSIVAVALLALCVTGMLFWRDVRSTRLREQRNRDLAESAQLYQDVGWQRLREAERPLQALPYLLVAGELTEKIGRTPSQSLRMLVATASHNLPLSPPLVHSDRVLDIRIAAGDGRVVIGQDNAAVVCDAATGAMRSPRLQHEGTVLGAAMSADGARIVTVGEDRAARVWDVEHGYALRHKLPHPGVVRSAVFSRDGAHIATSCADGNARVWDDTMGQPVPIVLPHKGVVWSAFDPGGRRVVTAGLDGAARVWDAATGTPVVSAAHHRASERTRPHLLLLRHPAGVRSAAFSLDGARIVTTSDDKTARVWDAASGEPVSPPLQHHAAVRSARFSPDGALVITASDDRTARIWDPLTGKPMSPPLEHPGAVVSAEFSADGRRVTTVCEDRTTREWDASTGDAPPLVLHHNGAVWSAAFSADGTRVVTASDDRTAQVWDAATGLQLSPSLPHQDGVVSATFSPNGARVVTASKDRTARVWDATTGQPLLPPLPHPRVVVSAVFSRDGARVLTISAGAASTGSRPVGLRNDDLFETADHIAPVRAIVWSATSGAMLSGPLQQPGRDGETWRAVFDGTGARLLTMNGNEVRLWDAHTMKPVLPAFKHPSFVVNAAFSADGTRVVTTANDHTARIWNTDSGDLVCPSLEHRGSVVAAAFSPDGARVVTASVDRTARVWDTTTCKALSPPLEHRGWLVMAQFSSDGSRVVTASEDGTARVWDASTGKAQSPPLEHRGTVRSAEFSVDGSRVVTASDDGTAQIWNLPLASDDLAAWHETVQRVGLYELSNGVLFPRSAGR